ncbi:hypothetical protein [Coleofasciculus sp.]|uniref:hypothetical protein n=1 Tax=Coleofasciculus sp. TaxID=3100458 RepID=UPI003A1FAF08
METQEELAYLEHKLPRLRARLSCLQQLDRDLQQKTREDFDKEDKVGDKEGE